MASSDPIDLVDDPKDRRRLPLIGLSITGLYLVGLAVYLVVQGQNPATLPLNELGDFLAGVASPLAFLWLVLGYFQQGREIRLSSKALQLQAREMRADREERAAERRARTDGNG